MISIISAVGRNGELGKNNKLIWHIPKDMKFFKNTTMNHIVVMGRNTYESLPGSLPNRKMIVISSSSVDGDVETVHNTLEILNRYKNSLDEVFIIGGASIYKQFIDEADVLYLTEIDDVCEEADTFFPEFDKSIWNKTILDSDSYNEINFKICKYMRKN